MTSDYWLNLAKQYKTNAQFIWGVQMCEGEYHCNCLEASDMVEELACFAEWLSKVWNIKFKEVPSEGVVATLGTGASTPSIAVTPDD